MFTNISEAWQGMLFIEKIYWCFAIPFTILFIIQLLLTFIGGDFDDMDVEGEADTSVDQDSGIGFQFLTLKNLIAFFTIFGWVGIITIRSGLSVTVSVILSAVCGIIMMLIMAGLMYFMWKLTESGTLNLNNALGKICTVYLTIPAKRGGIGKVQIKVQGLQTLDALTDSEEDILTGSVVDVVEILNDEILVVKPSQS